MKRSLTLNKEFIVVGMWDGFLFIEFYNMICYGILRQGTVGFAMVRYGALLHGT